MRLSSLVVVLSSPLGDVVGKRVSLGGLRRFLGRRSRLVASCLGWGSGRGLGDCDLWSLLCCGLRGCLRCGLCGRRFRCARSCRLFGRSGFQAPDGRDSRRRGGWPFRRLNITATANEGADGEYHCSGNRCPSIGVMGLRCAIVHGEGRLFDYHEGSPRASCREDESAHQRISQSVTIRHVSENMQFTVSQRAGTHATACLRLSTETCLASGDDLHFKGTRKKRRNAETLGLPPSDWWSCRDTPLCER